MEKDLGFVFKGLDDDDRAERVDAVLAVGVDVEAVLEGAVETHRADELEVFGHFGGNLGAWRSFCLFLKYNAYIRQGRSGLY